MSSRRAATHSCLVVCPPGLESVVSDELADLGIRALRSSKGAVSADMTTRQLYAANVFLRCATRILVRVAGFTVRTFADLERRIAEVEWDYWIGAGDSPRFRVTSRNSELWHDGAVAQRFETALGSPVPGAREQLAVGRAVNDRVTVSVDSSGARLH